MSLAVPFRFFAVGREENVLAVIPLCQLLMQGSFTGPRIYWAASSLRTEASGYGVVGSFV